MGFFDYVADPLRTLQQLKAFTCKTVIASFPSIHPIRTPIRKIRYRIKRCPVRFYREQEIRSLARSAGFAFCEVEKVGGAGMDYVAVFRM
jgi:hypothetical protein